MAYFLNMPQNCASTVRRFSVDFSYLCPAIFHNVFSPYLHLYSLFYPHSNGNSGKQVRLVCFSDCAACFVIV